MLGEPEHVGVIRARSAPYREASVQQKEQPKPPKGQLRWLPGVVASTKEYVVALPRRMTTVLQVMELLASDDAPDELMAYEFSGAMVRARSKVGKKVMSTDKRAAEHDGYHYEGEAEDVVALKRWAAIWFVGPNCYQHLRGDVHCLADKKRDGRAWWGVAKVWWCVCSANGDMLIVEQPDTIAHDYVQWQRLPGVTVHNVRTGQWKDEPDKHMRLTTRNMEIEPPPYPDAPVTASRRRSQFQYADAEERDRARSTWASYVNMCASLARAKKIQPSPPPLDYQMVIRECAAAWQKEGNPLPCDFDNADARPTSEEEREYQLVRGHGDGRTIKTVDHARVATGHAGVIDHGSATAGHTEATPVSNARTEEDKKCSRAQRFSKAPDGEAAMASVLEQRQQWSQRQAEERELLGRFKEAARRQQGRAAAGQPLSQEDEVNASSFSSRGKELAKRLGITWSSEDEELAHPTEGGSDRQRTAVRVKGASLQMEEAGAPAPGAAVVVPICLAGEEPLVYVPADESKLHTLPAAQAKAAGYVEAAEKLVHGAISGVKSLFGYRAGTGVKEEKLLVVAADSTGDGTQVARTPDERGRLRSTGVMALWCTLAALGSTAMGCTAQADAAQLAMVSATQFLSHGSGTTTLLQGEMVLRDHTGLRPGRTGLHAPWRPRLDAEDGVTPRQLIGPANEGVLQLREALRNDKSDLAEYYKEWADSADLLALANIPDDLLDQPLPIADTSLDEELFSEPLPVYELPWLPRAPPQVWDPPAGCEGYAPRTVLDLVDEEANGDMRRWFDQAQRDYKCLEEHGPACDRKDKPSELAIGQDQFHRCARGYIWDCRPNVKTKGCGLLDYTAPMQTDFDLKYLERLFEGYPDQRLASNVLEGVRLEADPELQIVLMPPLVSIGEGYESVQKTVRELRQMGFYEFFRRVPFAPIYVISQGSRIKKLGVKKYRRTSNFSAPHKLLFDKGGVQVTPINTASRCYLIPSWMADSRRPAMVDWLRRRYEHVPHRGATDTDGREHEPGGSAVSARYKFPKEHKPGLPAVMRDSTLLLKAAIELEEPPFNWLEDAAFYFNQLGYASEELWKSNLIVGARPGDVDSDQQEFDPGGLVFVSEMRLGFGSYASSNIAQRFSNALVGWVLQEFDRLEAEALDKEPEDSPWRRWVARRQPLEAKCRRERPKRRGRALSDCTQTRLAYIHMYTDDPLAGVVGVERAMRLLRAWRTVTGGIRVTMAGADKRQIGAHAEWIGVIILIGIGLVVIPRDKLIRARDALQRTARGEITFSEYRALMGLLEHLRFVAMLTADVTSAMYRPHGAHGESRDGPSAIVRPDELMLEKIKRWIDIIMSCAGALVTAAFATTAIERMRAAHTVFAGTADAAGDGEGTPGFGGYLHGFYWRVALHAKVLVLMHITAWETLATAVNTLIADRLAGPEVVLALKGDAALTPYAMSKEKSRSRPVQYITHLMASLARYRDDISKRVTYEHLSGDMNVPADAASRGLWAKLRRACAVLRVRPAAILLNEEEKRFVWEVISHEARQVDVKLDQGDWRQLFADPPDIAGESALRCNEPTYLEGATSADDGASDDSQYDKKAALRRRLGERQRTLTPAEAGRGKKRRDNTDGDGPASGYRPSWARAPEEPAQSEQSAEEALQATSMRYRPSWARPASTPSGKQPYVRPAHRRAESHPYLQPAYRESKLQPEQREDVTRFVHKLVHDRTPGRIGAPEDEVRELAMAVAEAKADGVNPRTSSKDQLAWREWQQYAQLKQFDPNLRSEWTKQFPERESLKLSGYLLFRAQRMKGRARGQPVAKPMSVYQSYLALRRVFAQRRVELPPSREVRQTLRGLVKRFVRRYGIETLRPKRVEPITPWIVGRAVKLAQVGGRTVSGIMWELNRWQCFIVTAWMVINLMMGSRKGESTKLDGDVDHNDWFTRRSLSWSIGGRTVTDPSPSQLNELKSGRDSAKVAPKGAKCDAFGTCHGTEPIILPFHDNENNPAFWLREIERRWECHGGDRDTLPLFCDEKGEPFTDSRFARLIMAVLTAVLGEKRAKLYSPHSWRVWLASALRMCNASDGLIMAFGRWLNPDSIKIYARLGVEEYTHWMNKIMQVTHIDATRTTNMPATEAADCIRAWWEELGDKENEAANANGDAFDARAAAAAETAPLTRLEKGTRIEVYWTEMYEWYRGAVTRNRKEIGDDAQQQIATRVVYDPVGNWKSLAYWHCLDDEQWRHEQNE